MKPFCAISFLLALGTALALSACADSGTPRSGGPGNGTTLRDTDRAAPEMERKSPQTLEDVKRNTENPASGAIIVGPPVGQDK